MLFLLISMANVCHSDKSSCCNKFHKSEVTAGVVVQKYKYKNEKWIKDIEACFEVCP